MEIASIGITDLDTEDKEFELLQEQFDEEVTDTICKLGPAVVEALKKSGAWEDLCSLPELDDAINVNSLGKIISAAQAVQGVINVAREAVDADVRRRLGLPDREYGGWLDSTDAMPKIKTQI